jgi:hypothetical protein
MCIPIKILAHDLNHLLYCLLVKNLSSPCNKPMLWRPVYGARHHYNSVSADLSNAHAVIIYETRNTTVRIEGILSNELPS